MKRKTALRFDVPQRQQTAYNDYAGGSCRTAPLLMGCIKARFYEAVDSGGHRVMDDHEVNHREWGLTGCFFVADQEQVRTSQGSTVLDSKRVLPNRKIKDYSRGTKLGSVTIYYGSTASLISLGVIRPSPMDLKQIVLSHVGAY